MADLKTKYQKVSLFLPYICHEATLNQENMLTFVFKCPNNDLGT